VGLPCRPRVSYRGCAVVLWKLGVFLVDLHHLQQLPCQLAAAQGDRPGRKLSVLRTPTGQYSGPAAASEGRGSKAAAGRAAASSSSSSSPRLVIGPAYNTRT